jgi:S-adenosylmethionine:tRNA ribosyltransferase-isomerase
VRVELFDFELPEDRIARFPSAERAQARLLVVDPAVATDSDHAFLDRRIVDLPDLIPRGALLVLNDTRVVPARLRGHKEPSGGKVELLLVTSVDDSSETGFAEALGVSSGSFRALARASKPLRAGAQLAFGPRGELRAEVERPPSATELCQVRLTSAEGTPLARELERLGEVPLPPYLGREAEDSDRERYQTVYARSPGAIAAPTAGLHLTGELFSELERRDVRIASLTLHTGLGTFKPVEVDDLDRHPMHAEWMQVSSELAAAINEARARAAPVVAIGTTAVRALESAADPDHAGRVRPMCGPTRLLIQPGFRFQVVDAMLTNFHLPKSTLLALVSAFAGRERVLAAYAAAIARGYRFYSYGDAMLLVGREDRARALSKRNT